MLAGLIFGAKFRNDLLEQLVQLVSWLVECNHLLQKILLYLNLYHFIFRDIIVLGGELLYLKGLTLTQDEGKRKIEEVLKNGAALKRLKIC